ncbi:MAG: PQQ-binding-like beta-propeller repeat protein [Pseudomonadota bacterium]
MTHARRICLLGALALVAACGNREVILEGERLDLRAPLDPDETVVEEVAEISTDITLPAQVNHSAWTHRNGTPAHRIQHPALSRSLTSVWSTNIGSGDSRKHRITADPVVSAGRVFTLDSQATVSATSTAGERIWSRDLTPPTDRSSDASGGGLAVAGNTVFVTTGFGELSALDVATGAEKWVQELDGATTGAPTVSDGLVYVVSRDSQGWAINAETGRIEWSVSGTPSVSNMVGGAGPVVGDKLAVFAFGSGELVGAFRKGGVQVWNSSVSGARQGRAYATVTDITGDPVIDGDVIYAANQSGRIVALNAGSGERIWTAKEGAYSPVWPTGNSVFLVSDEGKLVRLQAETGVEVWSVDLPYFQRERPRRFKAVFAHYGPVLAGGRLIVASSDGLIRSFDPVSGALISTVDIPGGATTNPVVVNGTLYVVSGRGTLHAFR